MSYGIENAKYDSTKDTMDHIKRVAELIEMAREELKKRSLLHDRSKLQSPEKEVFDVITLGLRELSYGSPEYFAVMMQAKIGIEHHHENNSHHPEFYKNGIQGFDLFDLVEMFLDWKAASERHADGDILRSIHINRERFGYSRDLEMILENTAKRYFGVVNRGEGGL